MLEPYCRKIATRLLADARGILFREKKLTSNIKMHIKDIFCGVCLSIRESQYFVFFFFLASNFEELVQSCSLKVIDKDKPKINI